MRAAAIIAELQRLSFENTSDPFLTVPLMTRGQVNASMCNVTIENIDMSDAGVWDIVQVRSATDFVVTRQHEKLGLYIDSWNAHGLAHNVMETSHGSMEWGTKSDS